MLPPLDLGKMFLIWAAYNTLYSSLPQYSTQHSTTIFNITGMIWLYIFPVNCSSWRSVTILSTFSLARLTILPQTWKVSNGCSLNWNKRNRRRRCGLDHTNYSHGFAHTTSISFLFPELSYLFSSFSAQLKSHFLCPAYVSSPNLIFSSNGSLYHYLYASKIVLFIVIIMSLWPF